MINVTFKQSGGGNDAIRKALEKFTTDQFVTVGIHEEAGEHESDGITNASLGAVHHFGAEINHPGGTSFGFATKAGAERGDVRFLKKGKGFMELGKTGAHIIKIPARPWLDVGVASGNDQYLKIMTNGIKAGDDPLTILNRVGVIAAAKVQQYMRDLKSPPNAQSTINQKGSSNPLVDSSALIQSVTYQIKKGQPKEGLE